MTAPTLDSITSSLRRSFIMFAHVNALLEKMEKLFSHECTNEEAENLFIIGESGVGKSRLLQKFSLAHPRITHAEFTEIPVLYVKVPATGSIDSLLYAMLLEMVSPFWDRGTTAQRTAQLHTLLKSCKVRLIILGELNHLIDKGGSVTHHKIADWLKAFAEEAKISFIISGIPRSLKLMDKNEQLRGRFREVITIHPFSMEDPETRHQFYSALKTFSKLMPGIPCVNLTTEATAKSILYATAGRLRDIRNLLVRSVELAFKNSKVEITQEILSQAFTQVIYVNAPRERNPFDKEFKAYPLIKAGEPFAPREE